MGIRGRGAQNIALQRRRAAPAVPSSSRSGSRQAPSRPPGQAEVGPFRGRCRGLVTANAPTSPSAACVSAVCPTPTAACRRAGRGPLAGRGRRRPAAARSDWQGPAHARHRASPRAERPFGRNIDDHAGDRFPVHIGGHARSNRGKCPITQRETMMRVDSGWLAATAGTASASQMV